ncbi:hypothetical protein [Desertivibrio insolitus]|uniref:hypothetical protein n=1 Tax=Herbiconiux sp. SYSU D00978 TaxID=2812562 RepID=UPI001A96A0F6|nr:hypothetical protein [Herbiconiux sp. SYSU D00978]
MPRLSPALGLRELPLPELCAARLDGELWPVGAGFVPVDEPDTAELRARSLAVELPPRLIAELSTAAWVWGALPFPPLPLELCAASTARTRALGVTRWSVREVVLDVAETVELGGIRVTTRGRTAADLLRSLEAFGEREAAVVRRLLDGEEAECRRVLGRRNLPQRRRALARLDGLTAGASELDRAGDPARPP